MANHSVAREALKEARVNAQKLLGSLYHLRYATDPVSDAYDAICRSQSELEAIKARLDVAFQNLEK